MEQTYVPTMLTTESKINGKVTAILKLEPVSSHLHRHNQIHTVKNKQTPVYWKIKSIL